MRRCTPSTAAVGQCGERKIIYQMLAGDLISWRLRRHLEIRYPNFTQYFQVVLIGPCSMLDPLALQIAPISDEYLVVKSVSVPSEASSGWRLV